MLLIVLVVVGCDPRNDFGDTKESAAAAKAEQLLTLAKTHVSREGGERLQDLTCLNQYSGDGEKGLLDPWGSDFHFSYVTDPDTQSERLVIWTVNPQSGKVVAAPHQFSDLVGTPK